MAVIWLPLEGTPAPNFLLFPDLVAMVGCLLMAGWATRRTANPNIPVH